MLRGLICMMGLLAGMSHAQEVTVPHGKAMVLTTAYGTRFDAYVAGPEGASRAVLLLHDRYGLNGQALDWADRFAGQGYLALAIDLYDGRHAKDWKHATSIMNSIDQVWADSDIAAALNYLKDKMPDRQVVVLGWDYGATQALLAAWQNPTAAAATITFYPTRSPVRLDPNSAPIQTIAGPIMVVVAKRDEELGTRRIQAIKGGLSDSGVNFNVVGLDALSNLQEILAVLKTGTGLNVLGVDADRGFSDPLSDRYDAAATATAWNKTQDFLSRYIKP